MLNIVDRDALVTASESMMSRLVKSGIAVIPAEVAEKHMEDELASAPKPLWFGRFRYYFLLALDEMYWHWKSGSIFSKARVYAFSAATWQRRTITPRDASLSAVAGLRTLARDALDAIPNGSLVLFELVQDQKILDPVLAVEEDGELAYIRIWKDGRILH